MSPSASSPINLTNQFLIAMPGMVDGNFAGTVVYLCEHNDKGALGLVINRPIDINLKHLFEKVDLSLDRSDLAERPVYLGGPVQTERGFVLHESLDDEGGHYNSTLKIEGGLEMTTSRDVLEALSNGAGPRKVFITLGYSGWTAGQLEEEISRNGWLNVDADPDVIFDTPVEQRYDKALSLLGIDRNFLMGEAGHA
ncbi:YqgE/AlgH family protein [Aquabacterium sp.]|jgi:putative transcriptional regulator|uniref:YqgE/AlgH family protein n=1 Tax=Aquabacterium sp. TaxID=1872578 RepID=UPI001B4EF11C|nr:YqgE/AlgH family protein [Aquabacterium sp.]MBP6612404.1 YqgE/AlgH family protein [Aquabacterium sp.]MBP6614701.1 YqgE/AlgH family protein [Aquabacterium sp.]MBP7502099.1 YqgE/AlgH family protein [Aquabacterium sp.]MDD2976438.1 YqgE/AlgH family protein [Aquabacterium sp.]